MKTLFKSTHTVTTRTISHNMGQTPKFGYFVRQCLTKHFKGNWGECKKLSTDDEDYPGDGDLNDAALKNGSRILSAYKFPQSLYGQKLGYYDSKVTEETKIWIITDAQDDDGERLATTVLYPGEY